MFNFKKMGKNNLFYFIFYTYLIDIICILLKYMHLSIYSPHIHHHATLYDIYTSMTIYVYIFEFMYVLNLAHSID